MQFLHNILLNLPLVKSLLIMAEFSYNRIKAELAEQHLTNKWLAEQMGKSETTVSRWVSNKAQPSVEQLYEIARLLKVEVFSLLKSTIEK